MTAEGDRSISVETTSCARDTACPGFAGGIGLEAESEVFGDDMVGGKTDGGALLCTLFAGSA